MSTNMAEFNEHSSREGPADESQAQMYAIMMADLGVENRDRITAIPEPEDPTTVNLQVLNRTRAANIFGTKEYKAARADRAEINAWNNAYEILSKDNPDLENEDIAGGQTHRARLTASLRQSAVEEEGERHGRSRFGNTARQSRGGGVARERGRGGRLASQLMLPPVARLHSLAGPSSRGGLSAGITRARTNINASPHEQRIGASGQPTSTPPEEAKANVPRQGSAQPFNPANLASPAAFFAPYRGKSGPPPNGAPSPPVPAPLPTVPEVKVPEIRENFAEVLAPIQLSSDTQGVQAAVPANTQTLPPHLRGARPSRPAQQVVQSTDQPSEPIMSPAATKEDVEHLKSQGTSSNIEDKAAEPQKTLVESTTVFNTVAPSAQLNLLDDDVPIEFQTPYLQAGQGPLETPEAPISSSATSYSNDLQDIDSTQGWEHEPRGAQQSQSERLETSSDGTLNNKQYIFDRIAQLTAYMPEAYRQEVVDLLRQASGFVAETTTTSLRGQTVSTGQQTDALPNVLLQRTGNLGVGGQGQTQLSQNQVREVLARGPVVQTEKQVENNIEIQILLRPGTSSEIVVPILRSREHPMFPDNAITRYYAGYGRNHDQPLENPDVLLSRSKELLQATERLEGHGSAVATESTNPSRTLAGATVQRLLRKPRPLSFNENDMPQFRNQIIPHELPPFLKHSQSKSGTMLEDKAVAGPQRVHFSRSSVQSSKWASTEATNVAQHRSASEIAARATPGPENAGNSIQPQHSLQHVEASTTRASDPGSAARAQYAKLGSMTSSATNKDPGAAARAQYAGVRRLYDEESEQPFRLSAGNPFSDANISSNRRRREGRKENRSNSAAP